MLFSSLATPVRQRFSGRLNSVPRMEPFPLGQKPPGTKRKTGFPGFPGWVML